MSFDVIESDLLADVITLRDEARTVQRYLIPLADPTGDARLAYGVMADRLDQIIEQANADLSGGIPYAPNSCSQSKSTTKG